MFVRKLSLLLLGLAPALSAAEEVVVASPDGRLSVVFSLDGGKPTYDVTRDGEPLIRPSRMGFVLAGDVSLAEGFELVDQSTSSADSTWVQPWGECREVRDHHNELAVDLKQYGGTGVAMRVVFRAFNDGVAFRYELPEQAALPGEIVIADEATEFALAGDWPAWWVPAFDQNRFEYVYSHTPISQTKNTHTPLTMQAGDRAFVSIHEAALVDYSSMALENRGGDTLKANLYPWSDGMRVRTTAPMRTPWRTIQVADTPSGLVESNLILNLNEPSKLEGADWLHTGKYVGVWWEMHVGRSTWGSGEKHGATTENVKDFIDFASEHGFKGVLVEGWNEGWDGDWMKNGHEFDFTKPYPDFDIEEISRYGAERGVYLIGHHETAGAIPNYERQLEDAFAFYEKHGVRAVKTGYVEFADGIERRDADGKEHAEWHHGQYMVRHHQRVLETAAKHKIMIVAHEGVKDTGLRRTWPNAISRECARGQEYNAWSGDGRNPPEHISILAYTRMLSGPMDFTPGVFDITLESGDRPNDRIASTLAKQLALYVVVYSPMQMACDFPEIYERHPDAFRFILDVPADWERTRAIDGVIGDYTVIARQERGGDDWYLGAVTDEEARTLETPLAFLQPGRTYEAQVYRDSDDAHWWDNPTDYTVESKEVSSDTVLTLKLAPGGGQAIRFTPKP
ncbi:Retaining alpha-galactosidase precursor [Planctomycetes bacterium MalM25]|nr:Retaining alpha-galactosidase precursor [Planctomycetes bacterium MalM25]